MTPNWIWLIFFTAIGANVGSFLNVVIYRMPAGISLVRPPSRCPHCEHRLSMLRLENVPVIGWLWLRGKCRKCKAPISIQYPLVEAFTALMFGGCFSLFYMNVGFRPPLGEPRSEIMNTWPVFVVWLVMLAGLIAATMIDAKHYIIPINITRVITLAALVGYTAGQVFGMPPANVVGADIANEPLVPMVGEAGAMIAWGGVAGLVVACVLLQLGVVPDSFEGEDDGAVDENGELPPLKHPRRVALRELMFLGFPLLGMLVGHFIHARGVIAQPNPFNAEWYYALAGCALGYLVGGGVIWLIRIFGTLGFGKEAMGLGDVHLLAAIGAVLGWHESVFICIFIAPFLGLGLTLLLKAASAIRKGLDQPIPYGPYLAIGAVLVLILGIDTIDFLNIYDTFMKPPSGAKPLFVP